MLSQEAINRGGGKLEMTRALLEAGYGSQESGIPIPTSAFWYYGDPLDRLIAAFQKMRKPVIVRGSHSKDLHGYIDVLPTTKQVETLGQLESAIKQICAVAASEDVRVHAKDWGQDFSPEVHVLVQEQSPSNIAGHMLRHPHPELIGDEYGKVLFEYSDDLRSIVSCGDHRLSRLTLEEVFEKWSHIPQEELRANFYHRIDGHCSHHGVEGDHVGSRFVRDNAKLLAVVAMYQALEDSGVLDPEWAYDMEFGVEPLNFFQARPFKRLQAIEGWELPFDRSKDPYLEAAHVFGITPKEGVPVTMVVGERELLGWKKEPALAGPHGIILPERLQKTPHPAAQLGDLTLFCNPSMVSDWQSRETHHNFLFHGMYRLMKKAQFSILDYRLNNALSAGAWYPDPADLAQFAQARFFSNGYSNALVPEHVLQ